MTQPADSLPDPLRGSVPGSKLLDLVATMDRLRSPGGCPWDAQQTHESLATYLLEETHETLEAIETGDDDHFREELGDLLLQVIFHARIAQERETGAWSIDDVAEGITEKLVRRHPHVFGDDSERTDDADWVLGRWEQLKREEKGRTSAVDGIPLSQPALALAAKLVHRAEKSGLEVAVPEVVAPEVTGRDQLGDLLFALVADATEQGIDAEQALRGANRRYADAVQSAERDQGSVQ
jgi:XTP/dITP diphosphohydrolase